MIEIVIKFVIEIVVEFVIRLCDPIHFAIRSSLHFDPLYSVHVYAQEHSSIYDTPPRNGDKSEGGDVYEK